MQLENIKDFILSKTLANSEFVGDRLPAATAGGKFVYTDNCGWTGGFWTGLLNYCYIFSGDKKYLDIAEKSRFRFLDRIYKTPETLDHDVGFLYIPSEYARYKLQGKEESKKVVLDAADAFLSRFNEKGKFLQAWNVWKTSNPFGDENRGRIIIDCMYNLPLLFWASIETGDDKYRNAAAAHAETCMKTIIRSDYTTFHTYVFNPDTGEPLRGVTFQGNKDDSCWSRGQAWALGGFTMAYRFTENPEFLNTAVNVAKKFISLLEPDFIPVWDFDFKGQNVPRDASAGAIAASGLLELAGYVSSDDKKLFTETAENIVNSLWKNYTSKDDPEFDGIIKHCTGFFHGGGNVDENLIYADYYFAEAVCKLLGKEIIL